MKLKAFFEKKNSQAKINNEDFNKVVEALPDVEIPDVWVNLFEDTFLTRERAESDQKINQKIKSEILNGVDANVEKLLPLLNPSDREEIAKEFNSFKKIELLQKAIPNVVAKIKEENPSDNEKVKQLEKNVKEFADKVTEVSQAAAQREKELLKQFETKEADMKLSWTLDKKFADYTFADEFIPLKASITKHITDTVKASNTLQLDDKGNIIVVDIDPNTGVAKPKFNGNDPVTIDGLLADPLKSFLKRNNANTEVKTNAEGKTQSVRQTQGDKDPSKMTLQERRVYEAQKIAV